VYEGGLLERVGLFNLVKRINLKMISILHQKLEHKVAKLKHLKLEVMLLKMKNKSEPPACE